MSKQLDISPFDSSHLDDKSVVIVGNGASSLSSNNGSKIDKFDIVVRFNLFSTIPYTADVGTKTTIWFCNRDAESPQIKQRLQAHTPDQIYIHTWQHTQAAVRSMKDAVLGLGLSASVVEVQKSDLIEMRDYLGSGYSTFSTGAIGVWLMLKLYRNVRLVGFDWWHKPAVFHYCDNLSFQYSVNSGHQPNLEKQFFDKLAKNRRLHYGFD